MMRLDAATLTLRPMDNRSSSRRFVFNYVSRHATLLYVFNTLPSLVLQVI